MKSSVIAPVLFSLLLAAGCSSSGGTSRLFPPAGENPIRVESEPSEADVYVMGEKIGVTPAMISRKDVFPNIYPNEKLSLYGKITLRKEGCEELTRTVSTDISSNGLHAKLVCKDTNTAVPGDSMDTHRSSETAERRLDRIKDLLNKGLITEEEAKKTRARILNEL